MKVSVIIPCFNVEYYVGQMIESLRAQQLKDVEFIVVDDGSTDRTLQLIKELTENDSRFKVIEQDNYGVSIARNTGLQVATGDYLMFVDADDLVANNAIEQLYQEALMTEAEIVYGKIVRFNSRGEWYAQSHIEKNIYSGKYKNIMQHPELFYSIGPCAKLYSKKVIGELKFPEQIIFGEDQFFTFTTYTRAKKIVFFDKDIYYYRVRELGNKSLTQSTHENAIGYMESLIAVYRLVTQQFNCDNLYSTADSINILREYSNRMFKYEFFPIFKKGYRQRQIQDRALKLMQEFLVLIDDRVLAESYFIMRAVCVELTDIRFLLRFKNRQLFVTIQRYIIEVNEAAFEIKIKRYYPKQYQQIKTIIYSANDLKRVNMRLDRLKHGLTYVWQRKCATKVYRLIYECAKCLPMQKQSVVLATTKQALSDNLTLLAKEIKQLHPNSQITLLKKTSNKLQTYYKLGRAKAIIIDDYYSPLYNKKIRQGAEYIQIWHAMGALKKFGLSAINKGDSNSRLFEQRAHSQYTKVLCSSPALNHIYAEAFGVDQSKIINGLLPTARQLLKEEYQSDAKLKFQRLYPELTSKKKGFICTYF
ncbi:bifunctional glycosyltransferase/CDP-glycerol:glycerophosphate glycerophosphotransferase [Brochothrix campestris]|uniref:Glycosyltransferase 2-like domain-containing protein n=1 Tax=Brochothrix campestris FSL F6-1037 TaxID=1265861 RepID=W7CUA8_9LIST|nr:glycosyltransferase [Brochothrix campestris]EUJ39406.1 hypothetical protein BCAMP_07215 [Brochothrix campestris FSL F6-1037]